MYIVNQLSRFTLLPRGFCDFARDFIDDDDDDDDDDDVQ